MADNVPARDSALPYFFAAIWGLVGCIMLAMGSHPPAAGLLVTGGQFLLFHAAAVMGVANQTRFGGVYKRAALALMLVGSGVFATEILIHTLTPGMAIPLMAPLGGGLAMLGWICVAIGVLRMQK
ncbi:MAG: hypothetical protein JF615_11020 [Asticcacaulis sp.]|nr:hypothetical protein [Asticcacaulis sp.]